MGKSTRHTDAAFSPIEAAAFLLGDWTPCRSSNVKNARYLEDEQFLEVEFKDGTRGGYPGTTPAEAEAFADAPSKMGHLWDAFITPGRSFVKRTG